MKPLASEYGRFLYYALEVPGSRPRDEVMQEEFEDLVRAYESDEEFRREMGSFFYSLNIEIADVSITNGIVALPIDQVCIFSTSIDSYRKTGLNNPHVTAIILIAIICCFYREFEANKGDNSAVSVTVSRVQGFLANAMKRFQDSPDQDAVPIEMQQMWVELDKLPQDLPASGRASFATVQGAIILVLNYLTQNKMLREGTREMAGEFIATPRLRIHVKDVLEDRLYKTFYNMMSK